MWLTKLGNACLLKKKKAALLNFRRSAALLYESIESTESGLEQGKVIKCNRVFADCPIRKQRFDNLIFVIDYLNSFLGFGGEF